jgi:hypothetical protein
MDKLVASFEAKTGSFDERGFARFQGFGDFRMDAERQARSVQVGRHFSGFGRDSYGGAQTSRQLEPTSKN